MGAAPSSSAARSPVARAALYGLLGIATELAFTGIRGRARTSPWMLPVYALLQPLYEPAHDRLRGRPRLIRAPVYALGFMAVEYASGRVFRRLLGRAPWDYSYARLHVDGLVRADFLPLWAAAGLGLEPVHDLLTRRAGAATGG